MSLVQYKTRRDAKVKQRKYYLYDSMMTPYDKLKSLLSASAYLKLGISFEILDTVAYKISDNQAADLLKTASRKFFKTINRQALNTRQPLTLCYLAPDSFIDWKILYGG